MSGHQWLSLSCTLPATDWEAQARGQWYVARHVRRIASTVGFPCMKLLIGYTLIVPPPTRCSTAFDIEGCNYSSSPRSIGKIQVEKGKFSSPLCAVEYPVVYKVAKVVEYCSY